MAGGAGSRIAATLTAVAVAFLLFSGSASAATITVGTTDNDPISEGNDGDCTLREAVQAANTNAAVDACPKGDQGPTLDTIELGGLAYPLGSPAAAEDENEQGDLDIESRPGAALEGPLLIDGTAAGATIDGEQADRVIHHESGDLTLSDLTITGGSAEFNTVTGNGGGILSVGANLTLTRATVTDNQTTAGPNGGGIYFASSSASGTLTVTDSEISDNLNNSDGSGDLGGGIAVGGGDLVVTRSTVTGNDISETDADGSSHGGGGVWAGGSPPEIVDSTISGNTVTSALIATGTPEGGGVYFTGTGAGEIRASTISGNQVIDSATETLAPTGGGVAISQSGFDPAEFSILNSTIASNTVSGDAPMDSQLWGGGGLFARLNGGQNMRVTHSTLTGNESPRADVLAGGFGNVILKNSIFDDPDSTFTDSCEPGFGVIVSAGHNVAEGTTCVDGSSGPGDAANTDPLLEPLGAYGGPTETAPPRTTSPALDRVPQANCDNGAFVPTALDEDQRGLPRPVDRDGDSVAECDAGSVELQLPPPPPAPGPTGKCAGKNATIVGTSAGELLKGTPKRDVIDAKAGNDTVRSVGGNDLVCGKAGKDLLVGGTGRDVLNGGPGRDRLKGGRGKDRLLGKGGRDRCAGGGGRDRGRSCERRAGIP